MTNSENEVNCSKCRGSGRVEKLELAGYSAGRMSDTDCRSIFRTIIIKCPKCNGRGKIDWVKNVIGI
jgi:DnaJ-class molecular chaperone